MTTTLRKVKVEDIEVSFNVEPYMVGPKQRGYLVHGSPKWNSFRISTLTRADDIIVGIARLGLPKVSVTPGKSPKTRRKLNSGERERIRDRAAGAGQPLNKRGSIPDDLWDKFNDEAWMASKEAD